MKEAYLSLLAARRHELGQRFAEIRLNHLNSIIWEIGSGHGHFLVRYAQQRPDNTFIGVDIVSERIGRSERKRDRAGLRNCHFIHANAGDFLAELPETVTCAEVFVLFPDPWPKARHHKHRLLKSGFMQALAGRCLPGARFYFRTDHAEYFSEVRSTVGKLSTWKILPETLLPLEMETVFQARADSYQTLVALRTSDPVPATDPTPLPLPMPAAPTSAG